MYRSNTKPGISRGYLILGGMNWVHCVREDYTSGYFGAVTWVATSIEVYAAMSCQTQGKS